MTEPSTPVLPPSSNTGVEPDMTSVGWLTASHRPEWLDGAPLDPFVVARLVADHRPGGSTMGYGSTWYGKGIHADDGTWTVLHDGVGGARGSLVVTLRGTATEACPELVLAVLRLGMRASRVDLTGDVHDGLARPRWYFDRRALATTRTHRDRWVITEAGTGLTTLTLGARASDRMARIYDKPFDPEHWRVRHELELKGKLAASIGDRLVAGADPAALWRAEYGRLVEWR